MALPFNLTPAELANVRTRLGSVRLSDHHIVKVLEATAIVLRHRCGCVCPECRSNTHCCVGPCGVSFNEGLPNVKRLPPSTHNPKTGLKLPPEQYLDGSDEIYDAAGYE